MATLVVRNGYPSARRSVRRGGRVTSEYLGCGLVAVLAARMDLDDAKAKGRERRAFEVERREWGEVDRALAELASQARAAAFGAIEAAGYRLHHRGEWRKARG